MDNLDDSADIFANSSTETVMMTDSSKLSSEGLTDCLTRVPSPSAEDQVGNLLRQTSHLNSSSSTFFASNFDHFRSEKLFCPFCSSEFDFKYQMKEHVKETHMLLLHKILKTAPNETEYHSCPFCLAIFYIRELLPRHILAKHKASTGDMFPDTCSENIRCYFCQYTVLRKHYQLLIFHLEKKHYKDFEEFVYRECSKPVESCDDVRLLDSSMQITTQILTPGISDQINALNFDDKVIYARRSMFIKSILKTNLDSNKYSNLSSAHSSNEMDVEDNFPYTSRSKPCRKLRFEVPESLIEDKKRNYEMRMKQAFAKKEKKLIWKFNLKKKTSETNPILSSPLISSELTPVKQMLDGENIAPEQSLNYKCGLCGEQFYNNHFLLEHIKHNHKGIALKSRYHCGECGAKFFKNRSLVQHCNVHHSPLCLKRNRRKNTNNF